jgi:replication factor A1
VGPHEQEGNNKKVVEENGQWYCEANQKTYDSCTRRYKRCVD